MIAGPRQSVDCHGRAKRVLRLYGPGDLVGDDALLNSVRTANVEALTQVLPADRFRAVLARNAEPATMQTLIQRQRDTDLLSAPSDRMTRFARLLVYPAGHYGTWLPNGEVIIEVPLTQGDLGSWVGMGRRSVHDAVTQLDQHHLAGQGDPQTR
jgi:CRP-like cAMP-binding protein